MEMADPLGQKEISEIAAVLEKAPSVQRAAVFGSRALGSYSPGSDIDIALCGDVGILEAEHIRCELDELPFICKFDVVAFSQVKNDALRDHIERAGVAISEKG
jgi:predicted nucleotidyltransferase